ncbi:MAG: hypothetical protein QOH88_2193 [Verrucomicrobiota bacterium]|jgi:hypothetical protein
MAHEVFISYTTQNKTAADGVCAGLEREKLRCWIAPRDVLPGSNYGESIVNAIECSRVVVLIFSSASNLSPAVQREMERAMHFAKPIIPFRLEDVPITKGMEFYLASCHWLDAMSPPIEQHINRLAAAVHGLLGKEWSQPIHPVTDNKRAPRALLIGVAALVLMAAAAGFFLLANRSHRTDSEKRRMPSAAPAPANIPTGLSLDVQVRNPGEAPIMDAFDTTVAALTQVRYELQREEGVVKISPACAYRQRIGEHAVVPVLPAAGPNGAHFNNSPLVLVLQLLNDTSKALSVHRIELQVSESVPEIEPILVVHADAAGLQIFNEGWAPIENGTLQISAPEGSSGKLTLAAFEKMRVIPWSQLTKSGTPEQTAKLAGTIEYFWFNKDGVRNSGSFRFESRPGEPMTQKSAVTATSKVEAEPALQLEFDKSAYSVTGPLARQLTPGENDQVEVLIAAPRTSHHRFHLLVHYNDGQDGILRSPEIDLEYFAPRSVAQ